MLVQRILFFEGYVACGRVLGHRMPYGDHGPAPHPTSRPQGRPMGSIYCWNGLDRHAQPQRILLNTIRTMEQLVTKCTAACRTGSRRMGCVGFEPPPSSPLMLPTPPQKKIPHINKVPCGDFGVLGKKPHPRSGFFWFLENIPPTSPHFRLCPSLTMPLDDLATTRWGMQINDPTPCRRSTNHFLQPPKKTRSLRFEEGNTSPLFLP